MSVSFKKVMPVIDDWRNNVKYGANIIGKAINSFTAK